MGFEGEFLVSDIPTVDDVPLSVLTLDDTPGMSLGEDSDVPVAEFQSSV